RGINSRILPVLRQSGYGPVTCSNSEPFQTVCTIRVRNPLQMNKSLLLRPTGIHGLRAVRSHHAVAPAPTLRLCGGSRHDPPSAGMGRARGLQFEVSPPAFFASPCDQPARHTRLPGAAPARVTAYLRLLVVETSG